MVLRVRGIDGGLHFIERERLRRVDALVAAARAVDLDPIRSGGHARLCLLAIIGSGPACARGGDALARDEHSWPDHLAHVDQIAHRVVDLVRGAEIAHRRHAGFECAPRVLRRERGRHARGPARLTERPRPGRAVPEVGHVRVHVDHSGDDGVACQVDHVNAGGRRAGADRLDAIVIDDDDGVGDHLAVRIDRLAGANRLRCRESRRRNQREREPCQTYPLYPTTRAS